MKRIKISTLLLAIAVTVIVTACGGGGGSDPSSNTTQPSQPSTPTQQVAISGKAIDGYLGGATVCVDMNDNGVCDAGEPTATTAADGSYTLNVTGSVQGKKILAVVTTSTTDASRPGYNFPAGFTLSAVINNSNTQQITPLTTMVAAQVTAGKSVSDAQDAVNTLIGGTVDLNADYMANGDTNTAQLASTMVNKIVTFASNGTVNAATVNAVMNAIAAKSDVNSVTISDVNAQMGNLQFSAVANATTVLNSALYSYDGFEVSKLDQTQYFGRSSMSLSNGALTFVEQKWNGQSWVNATPGEFDQNAGAWLLVNGAFSDLKTQAQQNAAQTVTASDGASVTTTDSITGINTRYMLRSADVSGKTMSSVLGSWVNNNILSQLTTLFAGGSTVYTIEGQRSAPLVSLYAYTACSGPTITTNGVQHCNFIGDTNNAVSSISQVYGQPLSLWNTYTITINANNTASIADANQQVVVDSSKISWSYLAGSNNLVVVFNINQSDVQNLPLSSINGAFNDGAQYVIALNNGVLMNGELNQGNRNNVALKTPSSVFDQIFSVLKSLG